MREIGSVLCPVCDGVAAACL